MSASVVGHAVAHHAGTDVVGPWRARLIGTAIALSLGGALALATVARLDRQAAPAAAPPIASAWLAFSDLPDGGVAVRNASTQALIATIPARDDGFLRMTLRLLGDARARANLAPARPGHQPFLLTKRSGGSMQLSDPATGQHIELEAFGPSNIAEFSRLLEPTP